MKKKIKLAMITTTTALLAMGSAFTSMAAEKGTWKKVDGEWYCFDADGDAIEDTFCLSNGKEFYVGEDGRLVRSSWVDVDGTWYYVNSAGEKVVNEWRYTIPAEDEDGEEAWYYLQSKGKRAEGKKLVINGETYFFDSEGKMLTGWVQKDGDSWGEAEDSDVKNVETYYCDEDGARVSNEWVKTYGPNVDEDDNDADEKWYYIKSTGKPATGKQTSINGHTYFFNNNGEMLTGWVAGTESNYEELWNANGKGVALSEAAAEGKDVYFCGSEDDGHAKKDKWHREWSSVEYGENDNDNEKYWYYILKNGKVYIPTEEEDAPLTNVTTYLLEDVTAATDKRFSAEGTYKVADKEIKSKTYLFNEEGQMMHGFIEMDDQMFYFGEKEDGARKTGSFTVKDENGEEAKCYFSVETKASEGYYAGAGINGAKSGKLYADGILVTATEDKYEIKEVNEMEFIVNKAGSIQTKADVYKDGASELFGGAVFTYDKENKGVSYGSILTRN